MAAPEFLPPPHTEPCTFCGETCEPFAGDPSRWPIVFAHVDGDGWPRWHHAGCVADRLHDLERAAQRTTIEMVSLFVGAALIFLAAWIALTVAIEAVLPMPMVAAACIALGLTGGAFAVSAYALYQKEKNR